MPGKVKVKIIAGRNLPVMDRSSDTTDAYVEIKLGGTTYKTDVCRKSLHPQWNSEWYRFEVDDSELQDEPLQMRLMDHDTYSANDAIGKVYLDLNPLLLPSAVPIMKYGLNNDSNNHDNLSNSVLSGWIPVYDTMHGIRGEVNVIVKVELFSDFNRYRQSSCGVQFFYSPTIPHGYYAQAIYGFVEELVVNDDPEYQWIDKIRTPRASNEARQTLFFKLSGELQRKIGVKALEFGANAVIGYRQCFDLEGESGIVARGIGTAAFLVKITHATESSLGNEERYQSFLNPSDPAKSFRLNVEPFNSRCLFPFQTRNPISLRMRQSRSLDHPSKLRPITLIKGSSLKSILDQEDNRHVPGIGFSQRVRNFRYNFIKDKDVPNRNRMYTSISKRKLFMKKSDRPSIMAEMLARSVLDCHNNLAPVIEHQDSGASDKSISEKCSSCSDLDYVGSTSIIDQSELNTPNEEDDSIEGSISPESSSSDDISERNNRVTDIVNDTISDIVRNLEAIRKPRYLTKQHSFSLNDLSSEYGSSLFSVKSYGFIDDRSCTFSMNKRKDHCIGDDISKLMLTRSSESLRADESVGVENNMLSYSDKLLNLQKFCAPKAVSYVEVSSGTDLTSKTPKDGVEGSNRMLTLPSNQTNFGNQESHDIKPESSSEVSSERLTQREEEVSYIQDYTLKDPKLIFPPIAIEGKIEEQSLVKTAMQTILLEKANIVGTYTPPISPTITAELDSSPSKLASPPKYFSFTSVDPLSPKSEADKVRRGRETVLGIPFQSISTTTLSKNSKKYIFLSDRELNKPLTELDTLQFKVSKTKSCFPNILNLDRKNKSKKNSLIYKFHYPGKKRLSLFGRKTCGNTLEHQRSFSSDDVSFKGRFASLSKSYHLPKMLSRLSLFKHKNKREDRSLSVFYVDQIKMDSDVNSCTPQRNILDNGDPSANFNPSELTSNNIVSENAAPSTFNSEFCDTPNNKHASSTLSTRYNSSPLPDSFHADHHRSESVGTKISQSPAKLANVACIHRRSSDSDLSITPKGNSLTGSDRSGCTGVSVKPNMILRSVAHQDNFDMLEYPFLTINKYPAGFIVHLGGAVSARSVKLLERISNIEEPESRDTWWSELRMEIRSHARALNCNAVLGYSETSSICEDVCVLSASGTAAIIGFPQNTEMVDNITSSTNKDSFLQEQTEGDKEKTSNRDMNGKTLLEVEQENTLRFSNTSSCVMCHLPYSANMQIRSNTLKCALCRNGKVPEVLITTIEAPDGMQTIGQGCFLQASIHRPLKDMKGESNAKEISDGLPFLEYELHRILINKLKIKGMNAIFGLKVRISIGERMLIGLATGTAVYLAPLHCPVLPKLISDRTVDAKKLGDLQKRLNDTVKRNREIYQLKNIDETQTSGRMLQDDDSEEETPNLELSLGKKECCLLEVDDPDDAEIVNLLMEESPPNGIHVVNTEFVPGSEELEIVKNLQMFKQIYRSKIQYPFSLNQHFQKLLQCIYFKLRRMVPCAVCDLQFRVDVPEADEVQISVLGMALGLGDTQKMKLKRKNVGNKHDDLIFNLEEVNIPENCVVNSSPFSANLGTPSNKNRQKSPLRNKVQLLKQRHIPYRERHGVDITPLSYIPGGKIERYLGNLNFFLIRETTSIREEGGLSGFVHSFATEVLAIVRAHVSALGGNGMVSYFLTECVLNYNLHKNQGQCLINVGGDVVFVSYYKGE